MRVRHGAHAQLDGGGARSRDQIAELMARAMAEGSHSSYKDSPDGMKAVWRYAGRTIEVTYAKVGGKVSDGWVV